MRKPFTAASLGALFAGPDWASSRPDVLRKQALFLNSVIMLAAAALAYPVALYALISGATLPILAASSTILLAVLGLVFHHRRHYEAELACQVIAIACIGLLLALADPDIVDFGLAIALMAAFKAVLVSQARHKHIAWLLPALVFGASALASLGGQAVLTTGDAGSSVFLAVAAYFTAVLIGAVTANRLNTAATASARTQMQTFSMLVESVRDAVVRFDTQGGPVFRSKSMATLLGCQRYELDGTGLAERVHVMDRPAYMAAISDVTARGLHRTVEIRMRRDAPHPGQAAGYVWIELNLSPVIDPGIPDGPHQAIGILRDVSARKDSETALERARHEAEQASEAKSRFLATIGHELRTPLNAIVGFSDMMQSGIGGTLSPGHHEYAGHIKQSGHHLLEVVNMLLDMSKIEAGKFEIQGEMFAPARLVDPCLQLVNKVAADREITITTAVGENLPHIFADERACRQILINLLSNAVKFSHDGGRVHLSMARQGKMLNISVSDEGVGMGAETIRRIGEPFLQEQTGLSRRYEGTGLGLSIVKGLVGLHDGKLHVSSEHGAGTTVTVLLPLDGPDRMRKPPSAEITNLRPEQTSSDEVKWLDDERKSAAR